MVRPTVRFGDITLCGDMAPIHTSILVGGNLLQLPSPTKGHDCYHPTICATGSLSVLANVGGFYNAYKIWYYL